MSQENRAFKFRRVTIRGAQPSARLSEEIYLSEGSTGVSQRVLRGSLQGSARFCGGPREFRAFSAGGGGVPKGPNLEKFQDRLKFSISLGNFNLA